MPDYRLLPAGDTALVVEFGERIDRRLNESVLALARALEESKLAGVIETVPTFRSLTVHYDPLVLPISALTAQIDKLMIGQSAATKSGRHWRLPVCYDWSFAPDLADVAALTGLPPGDVIDRHIGTTYHVYMLGFLPGQAYMGDLCAELALPRRQKPRPKIPAGSLAIAMTMTSIFPLETPCGWHLIGRCPVPLWERGPQGVPLIRPGDQVSFAAVSLREFERLGAQAASGRLALAPAKDLQEAAA